ncbi:Heme-binding protein 2 like protein [Argiope bruennichi]|uniref:Heme-binding protein 2 like protein n=1 Tax=Argiope bruennichi TaxID=94029 RepID=A0A8T0FS95_ARGBR|nr:Heme-binding protein 2 like protein [Argiope bruennichi]
MKNTVSFILIGAAMIVGCYCGCIRRGVECIEYQVVSRHLGYEERQYPATAWVSTSTEGPSLSEANREMYKKLFGYIQGHNVKGMKMNTTTPIRTRIVPCHGATCATIFIMSFLIPADMAETAPYPLDTALFIEKDPPMRYAVRVFEGRATETDWLEESHKLAELVKKDISIDKSYYYTAWYDPPYQLFHRINEIWMVKKTEKQPSPNAGNEQIVPETKDHKFEN